MTKIYKSLLIIVAAAAIAGTATWSYFSDTETVTNNTFSAGSLDLNVDGEEGQIAQKFSASNMVPGVDVNGGCVVLNNTGSIDGLLSVKVRNIISNENSLLEPETADGDEAGVEKDFNSYDGNSGDGELWDEMATGLWIEAGAGSHSTNGTWDWDDKAVYSSFGTPGNDTSGT